MPGEERREMTEDKEGKDQSGMKKHLGWTGGKHKGWMKKGKHKGVVRQMTTTPTK
jgi:hypothetical protein